jgi:hypothetical protein
MTTLNNRLTCSFVKIKIRNGKRSTGLYPTVICLTYRT